jgi:hypothetical protein
MEVVPVRSIAGENHAIELRLVLWEGHDRGGLANRSLGWERCVLDGRRWRARVLLWFPIACTGTKRDQQSKSFHNPFLHYASEQKSGFAASRHTSGVFPAERQ